MDNGNGKEIIKEIEIKEMRDAKIKDIKYGKRMGYICRIAAILLIVLVIAAIVIGYTGIANFTGKDGERHDGFGRLLDDVPAALSLILPQWAGFIWFFIDCLVILALVFAIDRLFVKSKTYFTGIKNVDF